ncbi:cytochrome b5 [Meredithblackwellia eburnea MCA 4105]
MGWKRSLVDISLLPRPKVSNLGKEQLGTITHIEHALNALELDEPPNKRRKKLLPREPIPELVEIALNGREVADESDLPSFTAEEISEHDCVEQGLWIVVEDRVYDVTTYVGIHPGGPEVFKNFVGKDCTWQVVWLWHNKRHLQEWSDALLIGIADPAPPNPFPKPKRIRTS